MLASRKKRVNVKKAKLVVSLLFEVENTILMVAPCFSFVFPAANWPVVEVARSGVCVHICRILCFLLQLKKMNILIMSLNITTLIRYK